MKLEKEMEKKGRERKLEIVMDIELIRLDGLDLECKRKELRAMARFFKLGS